MIWQLTTTFTSIDELEDFCNYIKSHNPDGQVIRTESTIRKAAKAKEQQKADPAEIFDKPEENKPAVTETKLKRTLAEVRKRGDEGDAKMREIFTKFNIRRFSDLPVEDYEECYKEAEEWLFQSTP